MSITIIVEFGEQRQRIFSRKTNFTVKQLFALFSDVFHVEFDSLNFDLFLFDEKLSTMREVNLKTCKIYPRFRIDPKNHDEKQKLDEFVKEIRR